MYNDGRNVSALRCPPLSMTYGTTRDSEDDYYQAVVTYTCIPGFSFPDVTSARSLICQEGGVWNSPVPTCLGYYY